MSVERASSILQLQLQCSLTLGHGYSLKSSAIPLSLSFPLLTSSLPNPKFRPPFPLTCCSLSDASPSSSSSSSSSSSTTTATTTAAVLDPSLAVKRKGADISPQLKGTSIFLVGVNSSIKTSLGKLLAEALRYYYFDSDSLVEEAAGAVQPFKETDEQGFRESETEVLKQLSSMGRLVVCAGNGAVQSSTNLALLRHGISLWIDVPLDMVAVESELPESDTPLPEVLAQLVSVYEEMREGYATADATISLQKVACQLAYDDLSAVTTEDMTLEVLKEIEKLTRVKKMMEEAAAPF